MQRIEYLLDRTKDPCEDFYQFSCSNDKRQKTNPHEVPKLQPNLAMLVSQAEGEFSFIKNFYKSCVSLFRQE